jgi:hypothetical protein
VEKFSVRIMLKKLAIFAVAVYVLPVQAYVQPNPTQQTSQNGKVTLPVPGVVQQKDESQNRQTESGKHVDTDVKVISTPARDSYDYAAFWVNVALALIGALGITAAFITLRKLERQTKAAEAAAKAQMDADRAWVLASVAGQPEEPLTGNLIKGVTPGIAWQIQIAGNTPARIIRIEFRCRVVDPDPAAPSKPMLEPTPIYLPDPNFTEGRIVSPPGEKQLFMVDVESEPNTRLRDRIASAAFGRAFLCSYGRVEYEDAFKRRGVTQFCALYRPPIGGVIKSPDGTVLNPPGFRIAGPNGYNYNT